MSLQETTFNITSNSRDMEIGCNKKKVKKYDIVFFPPLSYMSKNDINLELFSNLRYFRK